MNTQRPDIAPHSVDAEQQVIGSLLLDAERLARVSDILNEGSFYETAHGRIFSQISTKAKAGELVSPVSLAVFANTDDMVSQIGGAKYLVRLAGASVASDSIRDYAEIVADLSSKREMIEVMRAAIRDLSGDAPTDDVASHMEGYLSARNVVKSSGPVSMMRAVSGAMETAISAYHGEETPGVRTGIHALDRYVGKFRPGELILLGGRPSMGKSGVALSVALNVARSGGGVVFSTLEMTPETMASRALAEETGRIGRAVSYSQMGTGEMTEAQMRTLSDAAKHVAELPIHFLPTSYRDTGALFGGVKRAKGILGDVSLVVVDYLQILNGQGRSRIEQIAEISISLKSLAMQLQVPVLALSQLSRAVEGRDDKRPVLSDLRESGQLEQDADAVMFCYRDEYYLERMKPTEDDGPEAFDEWRNAMDRSRNKLEIIVSKQRQGPIGTAHVRFNPAINLIWED